MKFVIRSVLLLLAVLTFSVLIYFGSILFLFSYDEFISWVANSLLKKPHLTQFIPNHFTEHRFDVLKVVFVLIFGSYAFLIVLMAKKQLIVVKYIASSLQILRAVYFDFWFFVKPKEKKEKKLLVGVVVVPLLIAIYNIVTIPISYDESVSYIDFISNGPIIIGSLFHTTNNHILYNFLGYTSCIIFPDGEVAQRLPLLIIFLFCCLLLYALLKKIVNPYAALVGLSFFVLSTPVYLYCFMARGYLLVILFVLLSLISIYQLFNASGRRYWIMLFISSVLGMYTILVMAYFLFVVYLFLGFYFFFKNRRKLLSLLITGILTGVSVFILYLPVILTSGLKSVLQVVRDIGTEEGLIDNFFRNFNLLADFYLSSNNLIKIYLGVTILVGCTLLIFNPRKQHRGFSGLLICLGIAPILFTLAFEQRIFDRTWIYLIIPLSIFYAVTFSKLKAGTLVPLVVFITAFMQFFSSLNNAYYNDQKPRMYIAHKASDMFMAQKMKTIYIDHLYVRPMIEYRLMVHEYGAELYIGSSVYRKSNFDSTKLYDMIISTNHKYELHLKRNYIIFDSTADVKVFQLAHSKNKSLR